MKVETTSCGTCRRQITKMASQSRSKLEVITWDRNKISYLDICKVPKTRHMFLGSQIALNIDIKKPCRQQIQARCPWKYESSRWKCSLLVIVRFTIRHTTFRWFPKMYFRFHVIMSTFPVEMWQLYTAINILRSPGHCPKSAWPYILQFRRYRRKVDWGSFYPHLRDKG